MSLSSSLGHLKIGGGAYLLPGVVAPFTPHLNGCSAYIANGSFLLPDPETM